MGDRVDPLLDQHEEAEEALSLCDLPLHAETDSETETDDLPSGCCPSSSEHSEFFEFFSDFSSDMCSAEDIIICGKLVPFSAPLSLPAATHHTSSARNHDEVIQRRLRNIRTTSSSKLEISSVNVVSRSSTTNESNLIRNCRSLDLGEAHPSSRSNVHNKVITRSSSAVSVAKPVAAYAKRTSSSSSRPGWYLFTIGLMKSPTEMELRDMKSRQFRRSQPVMLLPSSSLDRDDRGKKYLADPSGGKATSKLLRVLSCKGHASVAVTNSFA